LKPLKRRFIDEDDIPNDNAGDNPETKAEVIEAGESPEAILDEVVTNEVNNDDELDTRKKTKKRKRKEKESDEEFRVQDIESRYVAKLNHSLNPNPDTSSPMESNPVSDLAQVENPENHQDEGDELDSQLLQHETVTSDSTDADKTIFISNLPVKVMTSKTHLRSLKTLFSRHGQIASLRFRSIAFQRGLPRKVSFIIKELHPERDTLNAYIVYESTDSVLNAVSEMNGFLWEGKHLRVDSVANPAV
jgi:nucleolar protein 12